MSVPFAELPELRGLGDYVGWPLQWGWHTSVPILHKKSGMGVIVQLVHQERLGPFQLVDPFGEELRREEAHRRCLIYFRTKTRTKQHTVKDLLGFLCAPIVRPACRTSSITLLMNHATVPNTFRVVSKPTPWADMQRTCIKALCPISSGG